MTYTTVNINNNFIKNIENNFNLDKNKNVKSEEIAVKDDKQLIIPNFGEENESEDKKTCNENDEIENRKNISNYLEDEKSQKTENKNENIEILNISEGINDK